MKPTQLLIALGIIVSLLAPARGDVKVPPIFSDHMVVQKGAKTPIWGKADPAEVVTVKVAGQTQTATAGADGKWWVVLDPIESAGATEIVITGKNTLTIKDVLVGEVWLCSGQSNMGFELKRATGGGEAVKAANRPTMRLFSVGRKIAPDAPEEQVEGKWELCTPESAAGFSAVAYFFGATLQDKLNTPVGLIQSSWGGTRAEAWIPRAEFDALKLPYEPAWTETWIHPKKPADPKAPDPTRLHNAPVCLYNGMIAPMAGYAIRGAVWYQGETNTAHPREYRAVLGSLIKSWREVWKQGDFPFIIVQLPNFLGASREWATLRASQAQVAGDLPNVGMVVTIDLGETKDIHPKEKLAVGKRIELVVEKVAYGKDVKWSGPAYKSMSVSGPEVKIDFDHADGGLVAKGGELVGFEVAGGGEKFLPAKARIEGSSVIISSEGVASPKRVRYAWANDPGCTLFNGEGLPAAPFDSQGK